MATNRFSAEQGRSAASAVNVVTRSGSDTLAGSLSVFVRDDALQGLPATFDRTQEAPPFDRQQYSATLGGPIARGKAWWFAAAEYRNQDSVVQTGTRDVAARTIRQSLAAAPLNDFLGMARIDVRATDKDTLGFRYLVQDEDDVAASTLDRSIGSATQRQSSDNRHQQGLATWTRVLGATGVNTLRASYSDFRNLIDPVTPGRQLTFPSIQDGASFRVPQGTTQTRWQFSDSLSWVKGAHTLRVGAEYSHTYGQLRPRRVPRGTRRAGAGLRAVRPEPRRPRGRRRPAVRGHAPQRQARPEPAARRLQQQLHLRLRPGRLARHAAAHAQRRPALRGRHRRQEHLGLRRHQPDRAAVPAGRPQARLRQLRPARRLRVAEQARRLPAPRRLRPLLRPRDARDHLARARARRPRAAGRGARRQRVLPRSRHGQRCRRSRRPSPIPSPASSCRARALPASTSSTTRSRTRPCSSSTSGRASRLPGDSSAAARLRAQPRHALHHRPADRRGVQPRGGRPRPRGQPGVERRHALRRAAREPREALGRRAAGAAVLQPGARPQLRERRPDPVRRRARSIRTTSSGSTARRRTSSATGSCSPARSCCRSSCGSPASGRSPPACRWTS